MKGKLQSRIILLKHELIYFFACWLEAYLYQQGRKLTFLGRRQLATDLFFSRQMGKCGRQKVSIKFFFAAKHKPKILAARWKILVTIFLLRIRTKRTPLGPQRRFFSPKNKIKYNHADYLYTYLHWKSTTKESNANHNDIHCFVWLSNF